jgi:flagellar hook-basal body complex protein FliE
MSVFPVDAILPAAPGHVADMQGALPPASGSAKSGSFAAMLLGGIADAEAKVAHADELARAFVLDDGIPVHRVTFALEEARMSLELMLQVRTRIMESYQQLMNMQF